jgi:prolyl-tRNA synthetase
MFNVVYEKEDGTREQAWITCHGISGRAIAGLISAHGDEKGLVLPPKFAPTQVVVVPIIFKEKEKEVVDQARRVFEQVKSMGWRAAIDESDDTPGSKFYKWENRGVPIRIEIGPRELANRKAVLVRRDNGDKKLVGLDELGKELDAMAAKMHEHMKAKAWEKQAKLVKKATIKEELDKKGVVFEVEVCSPACAKKLEKEGLEYRGNIAKVASEKCIQCGKKAKHVGILSNAY